MLRGWGKKLSFTTTSRLGECVMQIVGSELGKEEEEEELLLPFCKFRE